MPALRLTPDLFVLLREGFAAAASHPQAPFDPALLNAVSHALVRAEGARRRGPIVVALTRSELAVLGACFEVGAERLGSLSNDARRRIRALLEQAARATD